MKIVLNLKKDRNHEKYTICGKHHDLNHQGSWKTCTKCQNSEKKVIYDDLATNGFNFDPLKIVEKEEIWCRNCGYVSFDLKDFAGSTPCCVLDDNYFCKKPACKRKGGFDAAPGAPFVSLKIAFLFCENTLKVIH